MAQVFTWRPMLETPGKVRFRTHGAQFGDGFKQSVGDGMNNRIESWNLTFRGMKGRINDIGQFIDEHQGFRPFLWSPKGRPQGLYECTEYDVVNQSENGRDDGVWMLTATFNQRFAP